jgi:hypothetical protein
VPKESQSYGSPCVVKAIVSFSLLWDQGMGHDPLYFIDHGHDLPIIKTFELNGAAPA